MNRKFSAPLTRPVRLVHGSKESGEEVIELVLSPLPLGYAQFVETVYPAPVEYRNGEPVEVVAKRGEWQYEVNLLCIARALGSQVEASAPTTSDRGSWATYAAAVRAEFTAAGLVEGDYVTLAQELARCQRGAGALGKS